MGPNQMKILYGDTKQKDNHMVAQGTNSNPPTHMHTHTLISAITSEHLDSIAVAGRGGSQGSTLRESPSLLQEASVTMKSHRSSDRQSTVLDDDTVYT